MTDPDGGFYSAEDADSVIDPAQPDVKGEGAFYIWTAEEIRAAGRPARRPTGSATATAWPRAATWPTIRTANSPAATSSTRPHTVEETAEQFDRPAEEVRAGAASAPKRTLLAARAKRVRPHLDDKILTAWNGLMISAFAQGGAVLDEPRYAEAARRAAEFLHRPHVRSGDRRPAAPLPPGRCRHSRASSTTTRSSPRRCSISTKRSSTGAHLELAVRLTEKQLELFEDREHGGVLQLRRGRSPAW